MSVSTAETSLAEDVSIGSDSNSVRSDLTLSSEETEEPIDSDLEDLYEYESQSAPSQSSATASDVEEPIDSDLEDLYECFEYESQ